MNKICSSGLTPLGAAVRSGNLTFVKLLAESTRNISKLSVQGDEHHDPLLRGLDVSKDLNYKNVGYFVVCKDVDELGDGPTPEGMDALEWDMEISSDDVNNDDSVPSPPESSLYRWYAKILTQTSLILKSPDYDMARLDGHGQNVLHYAVKLQNTEIIEYLLSFNEIDVNLPNSEWYSPLHLSVLTQNCALVKLLLDKGARVNATNCKRRTALHFCAQLGNVEITNLLLAYGADVNVSDMEDRFALSFAILHEHGEVAKLLIKRGTKLNQEETHGYTVLYHSVWNNLYDVTEELLLAGAKIVQSHYLVHIAIRHSNFEIMKLLHKAGAIINIRDDQGNTPLMVSCVSHNLQIAKYLLKHGKWIGGK